MQPIIRGPGAGRTIAVVGDVYRFLATGAETQGRYAMWEAIVPPGGGPPPHVHSREEEAFYVLEGEVTFSMWTEQGPQSVTAGAGTFINLPVGLPHTFHNGSTAPARLLVSIAPAGMEQMFLGCGVPLPEGATTAAPPTEAEIAKLLELAPQYGLELRLPPPDSAA